MRNFREKTDGIRGNHYGNHTRYALRHPGPVPGDHARAGKKGLRALHPQAAGGGDDDLGPLFQRVDLLADGLAAVEAEITVQADEENKPDILQYRLELTMNGKVDAVERILDQGRG